MNKSNLKAQSWSIDIALGVIVFMVAFLIFYGMLKPGTTEKEKALEKEALLVAKQVTSEGTVLNIIDKNEINITKLNDIKEISYDELKRRLRIEGDFCIYLEDEKGNLVLMDDSYRGIGASNINISGVPCSQK